MTGEFTIIFTCPLPCPKPQLANRHILSSDGVEADRTTQIAQTRGIPPLVHEIERVHKGLIAVDMAPTHLIAGERSASRSLVVLRRSSTFLSEALMRRSPKALSEEVCQHSIRLTV